MLASSRRMLSWLLIAVGGGLGTLARARLGQWVAGRIGPGFPFGTLLINVSGSLAIGLAAALLPAQAVDARALVMVGLCGGFTTFSSFSLQTLDLLRAGRTIAACCNIAGSTLLCLAATAAGGWIAGG